jgi:hypothetical protein
MSTGRHTVARVFEYQRSKSGLWSRLEFWVLGQQYFHEQKAFARAGLLPIGLYWYVQYAVPGPDTNEGIGIQVPDSVRVVPATGWATLPRPPRPSASPAPLPAPPIPAAAPEPLTGPAASPVFRPGPPQPDSTLHSGIGPLPPPLPSAVLPGIPVSNWGAW